MIAVTGLTRTFGHHRAVDYLSFVAPPGRVTGFLGPNGAGKSTTLRMICGLTRADAGTATIDGARFADLRVPGRVVGVMIDASAQHPGRTGEETLRLAALANHLPASRVATMLERVGLGHAGRKKVGQYSLGMRQRLGIAVALVGDPRVLILDEPANGLDPEGMRWMRLLLDDFAADGGTVLLSSHLLGEVQAVADRIVAINRGRLVLDRDTADLLGGTKQFVDATDRDALKAALRSAGWAFEGATSGLRVDAPAEAIGALARESRLTLTRLAPAHGDLESVFLDLTHSA